MLGLCKIMTILDQKKNTHTHTRTHCIVSELCLHWAQTLSSQWSEVSHRFLPESKDQLIPCCACVGLIINMLCLTIKGSRAMCSLAAQVPPTILRTECLSQPRIACCSKMLTESFTNCSVFFDVAENLKIKHLQIRDEGFYQIQWLEFLVCGNEVQLDLQVAWILGKRWHEPCAALPSPWSICWFLVSRQLWIVGGCCRCFPPPAMNLTSILSDIFDHLLSLGAAAPCLGLGPLVGSVQWF